jgi:hypothetical protein
MEEMSSYKLRLAKVSVIFSLLSPIIAMQATAAETLVIDAYVPSTCAADGPADTNLLYAIRFYAGTDELLTKVINNYSADITDNGPSLRIYTDSEGYLGSLIGTLEYSSGATSGSSYSITYEGSVSLLATNYYWMEHYQTSSSVSADHCYGTTLVTSTNSWELATLKDQWWWRLGDLNGFTNPRFPFSHWSTQFYTGSETILNPEIAAASSRAAREALIAEAQVALKAAIAKGETLTIQLLRAADLFGSTNQNIAAINADITLLSAEQKQDFMAIHKVVIKHATVDAVASKRNIAFSQLVETGITGPHESVARSVIMRALRSLPSDELDTVAKINKAITEALAAHQMRKDRIEAVSARTAARNLG